MMLIKGGIEVLIGEHLINTLFQKGSCFPRIVHRKFTEIGMLYTGEKDNKTLTGQHI
jgi:hypothetical protein